MQINLGTVVISWRTLSPGKTVIFNIYIDKVCSGVEAQDVVWLYFDIPTLPFV